MIINSTVKKKEELWVAFLWFVIADATLARAAMIRYIRPMEPAEQTLQKLRARIDAVDVSLARLFIERIGIIREVAVLKAAHWPKACHIRPGREGQMHQTIAKRFTDSGFPPLMALAIWRQLIGGSTHVESPLNFSYLAAYPEHCFLAREYFGVQIGARAASTLTDALADLRGGLSNILIVPTAHDHGWWGDSAAIRAAGLFIFAALPVTANNLPKGCTGALALAAVSPEDSGDDVSYFVHPDGALEVIDGFVETRPNAIFLGAHPRPISLNAGVMYA